jgi:hypothetical protein
MRSYSSSEIPYLALSQSRRASRCCRTRSFSRASRPAGQRCTGAAKGSSQADVSCRSRRGSRCRCRRRSLREIMAILPQLRPSALNSRWQADLQRRVRAGWHPGARQRPSGTAGGPPCREGQDTIDESEVRAASAHEVFAHVLIGKPVPTFPGHAIFADVAIEKLASFRTYLGSACDNRRAPSSEQAAGKTLPRARWAIQTHFRFVAESYLCCVT